jgi:hypothetical protein
MAFLEYMLLAFLGSASATPAGMPARNFAADAVTQPSGGTEGLLVQCTTGSPGKQAGTGRKHRVHTAARHHRKGRRHTRVAAGGEQLPYSRRKSTTNAPTKF